MLLTAQTCLAKTHDQFVLAGFAPLRNEAAQYLGMCDDQDLRVAGRLLHEVCDGRQNMLTETGFGFIQHQQRRRLRGAQRGGKTNELLGAV